jgi:predicted amidohydrolase
LQYFHTELSVQASCCQTGMWAVSVAKAGLEERCAPTGGSLSVGPAGEGVARASTVEDELIPARVDLDRHAEIGRNIFNFSAHREPEDYQPITRTKG